MSGTIGIFSSDLARYSDFTDAMLRLRKPDGTMLAWAKGADITGSCNAIVENMEGEWLWFIGDDHVFDHDVLMRLLEHDVDIVVPLCLRRLPPYDPVVFGNVSGEDNGKTLYNVADLEEEGLQEVVAAGSAGMLIRRHVFEGMEQPWFSTNGAQNEDVEFCRKAREAGFQVWCDPSVHLGHIAPHQVWPRWSDGWQPLLVLSQDAAVPIQRIQKVPA